MTHEYMPGTIGKRIHDLLVEKKMTQAELAAKAGVSPSTITRIMGGADIHHPVLLQFSKALGVSVDFLLGNTNVPYRTNFDIDELGLTPEAAAKLYTGELDPHVVSQLLTNPYFPQLTQDIRAFIDGTETAALASYNQVMKVTGRMLQRQSKIMPHDKTNARNAIKDIKDHIVPPELPEMTMIRTAFEKVLLDLKRQGDEHVKAQTKLTSDIMDDMIHRLEKRHDKPDLRQYTVDDIVDAIVEQVDTLDMDEQKKNETREHLLAVFKSVANLHGTITKKD